MDNLTAYIEQIKAQGASQLEAIRAQGKLQLVAIHERAMATLSAKLDELRLRHERELASMAAACEKFCKEVPEVAEQTRSRYAARAEQTAKRHVRVITQLRNTYQEQLGPVPS